MFLGGPPELHQPKEVGKAVHIMTEVEPSVPAGAGHLSGRCVEARGGAHY